MSEGRATGERTVLALNCGSSSLKFGLYETAGESASLRCEGTAEEIGGKRGRFWFQAPGEERRPEQNREFTDHHAAFDWSSEAIERCGAPRPAAIGHRIVHGGRHVRSHRRITAEVLAQLEAAVLFAPLHVPAALSVVKASQARFPDAVQVACLDTAFHATMPDVSRVYPLPQNIRDLGVERYGFHGLSMESIVAQLDPMPERLVVAHLGGGASVTAIHQGRSVDTTMGLTPSGGLMMATRCGDLDPGVLLFLMRNGFPSPDELEGVVDRRSGLLGLSGRSGDVRELMALRQTNKDADLALRVFCYRARKSIAAMAAATGGVDLLVFTGGIGEHAEALRTEICAELHFLRAGSVRVLPAQEDLQIARITNRIASAEGV